MRTSAIYIDDTLVDIGRDEIMRLSLNYSIADIREVDTRSADFSHTITLPATATNRKLLGFPDIIQSDSYDQTQAYSARIEIGGVAVMRGLFKITGVELDRKDAGYIKGTVLAGNGDWKARIQDKKLSELDLSDIDHTFNKTNIAASWSAPGEYLYPIVDYGKTDNPAGLVVGNFRPAYSVRMLVERIMKEAGYKVTSSFLSSDFADRLFMLAGTNRGLSDTFREIRQCRVGLTGDQTLTAVGGNDSDTDTVTLNDVSTSGFYNSTNSNFSTSNYWYQADADSKAIITFDYSLSWAVPWVDDVNVTIEIYRQRGGLATVVTSRKEYNVPSYGVTGSLVASGVSMEAGDRYYIRVTTDNTKAGAPNAQLKVLDDGTAFNMTIMPDLVDGVTVETSQQMPDNTCLELIQSLKHLFNLYFYADTPARTVYIEPADDFYLTSSDAVDWSEKLNVGEMREIEFIEGYSKEVMYGYADDGGDALVGDYNDKTESPLMSYTYEHSNRFAEGTDEVMNDIFAATIMRRMTHVKGIGKVVVPTIYGDMDQIPPEREFEHEPRLLYFAGLTGGVAWNFAGSNRTTYPKCYSYDDSEANDTSLDFADRTSSKGLFSKYYSNTHATLDSGRLYRAEFLLSPVDIVNLDMRKPVRVGQVYYRINSIDGYNGVDPVEVELLKPASRRSHKPITEISEPDVPGWADSSGPAGVVPVMVRDIRLRPNSLLPAVYMDENGNMVQAVIKK